MRNRLIKTTQLLLIFCLLGSFLQADDITITAKVNSTNITLNDIVSYTVEIQGSSKVADIPSPEGANFSIVNGPFQSSNIQITNGKMETRKSYTWQLAPKKEGELIVNGFSVLVKRKKYSVNRVVVSVGKARYSSGKKKNSNQDQVAQGQQIFIDVVPSKESVYLGEQVIVEYKVIYNMRITNYDFEKTPAAKGFWIEDFPQIRNPQSNKIVIDGKEYMAATVKRVALFPTKTGKLEIDPLIMQCEVVIPQKKRSRSGIDSFFDDSFFNNSIFDRTKVKRVVSQPLTIQVKPLPEYTKSDTLPGVMERVSISGEVDTVEILQDKALTLKYNISGYGNINSINLDKPKLPDYVEVFPPKVNKKTNNKGAKIKGIANYEYVLIPHKAGKLSIPPIEFDYFDAEKGKYITRKAKGFEISVLENKNAITVNSGLKKEEIQMLDQDIRYILKGNVKWRKVGQQFYQNSNFIMINLASLLLLGVTLGLKFYKTSIGSNPVIMRKTKALKKAQDKIAEASQFKQENKIVEAISRFDSAVSGFIADRLNLPEAGYSPMDFKQELEKLSVESKLIEDVFKFLENMELYKYSPGALNPSDYQKIEDQSKQLISQLSKVI